MNERLDQWLAEAQKTAGGRVLGYDEERDGITVGLLHRPGLEPWDDFTCLNSLRDVEPNVGLIFHDGGLDADPSFVTAVSEDDEGGDEEERVMSTASSDRRKIGEIRPSQLLYTFGVGVDRRAAQPVGHGHGARRLARRAGGDGDQRAPAPEGRPARAGAAGRQAADPARRRASPPGVTASPFDDTANVGVPVAPFPRWQVCPYCRLLAPIQSGLFELRLDPYRKDRSRYVHRICKKPGKPPTVVPARFLVACEHGHLDDFPWVEFVHRGKTDCRYELRLYELGASGEVADIQVECVKCESKRRLTDAFSDEGREELARCQGRWPHLRKYDEDPCEGKQRAILLGASNSWFPIMLSVLSIPTTTDKLGQLVELNWAELEECESARDVKLKRKLLKGLAAYTEDQIWEAVVKRKEASGEDEDESPDLREPEWTVFSNPDPSLNSRDFKLRVVEPPKAYRKVLEKVVLAERLREVRALIGFTRIESPGDYTEHRRFPRGPAGAAEPDRTRSGCPRPRSGARGSSSSSPSRPSRRGSRRPRSGRASSSRPTSGGGRTGAWSPTTASRRCGTCSCTRWPTP